MTARQTPSLRALLSGNLRKLCSREPSIASLCRTLGINRQQFNNYLSARNLPNETVIRQLCEHFSIEPHELFLPSTFEALDRPEAGWAANLASRLAVDVSTQPALPVPGSYYIYFEAAYDPMAFVRSYMEVFDREGVRTFLRLTSIPVNGPRKRTTLLSRHEGYVRAEGDDVHWLGVNPRAHARPSLMVGRVLATPPILYTGIALIETGNGMENAGFAVTRAPERSLAVMRSLGLVTKSETPVTRVASRAIDSYRRSFSPSFLGSGSAQ